VTSLGIVRRNSFFSFLAIATRLLANTVLFVGIARFYGPIGFGRFTLAHVYFSILLLVADFGYDFFLSTEIGRNRSVGLGFAARIFPIKIGFSALASLAMVAVALFGRSDWESRWIVIIMAAGIPANALMLYAAGILRGSQDVFPEARVSFTQSLLLLGLLVVLGILRLPLLYVVVAFVASKMYGMIAMLRIVRKRFPELRLTFVSIRGSGHRELLTIGVTFGVHMICSTLYFQLDTLLLGHFGGDYAVAMYQSVMKLVAIVLVVNDVANMSFVPALAQAHAEEYQRWTRLGSLASKSMWLLGGLAGLLFLLCPVEILNVVYGRTQFAAAADIMKIFGVILVLRFGMEPYAMMLTTARMQRQRTIIVLVATLLNLGVNMIVIPRSGAMGAAMVSLGTNCFVAVSYAMILSVRLRRFLPLNNWGDLIILGAMATVGFVLWSTNILSLAVVVPILCVVGVLLVAVAFSSDEQRLVRAFFRLGMP
jgi:O-antigen/teichoic acid export membrane protein